MTDINKELHHLINHFQPQVVSYEDSCRDYPTELHRFNAGQDFDNFTEFVLDEAAEYAQNGDGVTYVVWNLSDTKARVQEPVAFYTLAVTAIPYIDRIRRTPEEALEFGSEFDDTECGIPALELKMFAVDEKYQDVFFQFHGETRPIAAWILRNIIDYAEWLIESCMGFKAIFLRSVPTAEKFYCQNGFCRLAENMHALYSIESDCIPMYLTLRDVHINYDE